MQRKLSGRCDIQEEFKEKISHLYKNNQLMVQVLILGMVLCWKLSTGTGHNSTFFWKPYIKILTYMKHNFAVSPLNKDQPSQPHAHGE